MPPRVGMDPFVAFLGSCSCQLKSRYTEVLNTPGPWHVFIQQGARKSTMGTMG